MRVINKLTEPGGIRRIDLTLDTVRIQTSDGQDRVDKLMVKAEHSSDERLREDERVDACRRNPL